MTTALSPAERKRLEELFDRAADLPTAEHAAFVERECGTNAALGDELALLLAALAGADIVGHVQPVAPIRSGAQIGPYTLLERVGVGGMGEVYAAEQQTPVKRRVALKLIKPGMDSREVVTRFEAERQALARMNHPNVAQVFDGGATDDGHPYFVMEFVDGEPITADCDRRRLSTAGRLTLFLGVCDGVQHAHQKGLIHRDLKPSNLLVMSQDGRAVPKIIDFGVARATTGRLADSTLQTLVGQIVGTLDYMSPEQADPTGVDIDTRSDVYSLGVVLYQLVSGLLPFEHHSDVDRPLTEIHRAIRELDPPTPSTRLRKQGDTTAAIAPLHGASRRSLIHELTGDLDWICLKALEKDPARRYQSVAELAADVRRHLAHEPVLAARPGALYRARKFVRRHRVGVTAGTLVAAGLVAGIYGIVSGRNEAQAQATAARLSAERAERERANVLRLSAFQDLEDLQLAADALWPVQAELVPDYDDWLRAAEQLVAGLDPSADGKDMGHRHRLQELRARARPRTDAERQAERADHPRSAELETKTAELAATRAGIDAARKGLGDQLTPDQAALFAAAEAPLGAATRERDALDSEVDERRAFTFADEDDRWWHSQLSKLVDAIEAFADPELGLVDGSSERWGRGIRWRRDTAASADIEGRTLTSHDARRRWEQAIASIADTDQCPGYDGLQVSPQLGLLPLGRDPDSRLWEFWFVPSGDEPGRDADGRLVLSKTSGIVLVLIPGGSFWMGAQSEDAGRPNYDPQSLDVEGFLPEGPVHEVTLPAFLLSKFEMTQGQWQHITGTHPGHFWPLHPVSFVSWTECDRAMRHLGLGLPTEEQWEYAARAGTDTVWWTGDEEQSLATGANGEPLIADNLFDMAHDLSVPTWRHTGGSLPVPWSDGVGTTSKSGTFRANPFGLHDVHGNVTEWCSTNPYASRPASSRAPSGIRMARGGNQRGGSFTARAAWRGFNANSEYKDQTLGLRPARALDP